MSNRRTPIVREAVDDRTMASRKGLVRGVRRWTAGLLAGALVLAVATPSYLVYARPSVAGYLLHPSVFAIQALPYGVAAVLWVPPWSWLSGKASAVLAALLVATSLMLYTAVLSAPEQWGGDMIALGFLAMSGAMTGVVVILSGLTALAFWVHRKRAPGPGP